MNHLSLVVGTRPQIIKLASLCRALEEEGLDFEIVHTGQHYDVDMDRVFFDELGLPDPKTNLGVGSGSHAVQTGEVMIRLEKYYLSRPPKVVVVPGDTNSALGAALVAPKISLKLVHVEAGLRSFQRYMPEEINRVIIDHASDLLFAPTRASVANLKREGLQRRTSLTGDVMADNVVLMREKISTVKTGVDVEKKKYVYVTLHRSENVDDPARLQSIMNEVLSIPRKFELEVVFPVHPRTQSRLKDAFAPTRKPGIHMIKPVGYLESLRLAKEAVVVVTDSGGLQKESFLLGTPVITLRSTTEWVEIVEAGWNKVVGNDVTAFHLAMKHFLSERPPSVDPLRFYGGGRAAKRMAGLLKEIT